MSEPCNQESTIKAIHKTLDRMDRAMEQDRLDRKEYEKQMTEILQKLTDNTTRIAHIEEHIEFSMQDNKQINERLRDLELEYAHADGPAARQRLSTTIQEAVDRMEGVGEKVDRVSKKLDKLDRFYNITTHKYALMVYAAVLGMIVSGTLLDFVYHKETIMGIYHFFKG